jgi:hypothetical protein
MCIGNIKIYMKKNLLIVVLILSSYCANATYKRTTSNGGKNGYYETSEFRLGNNVTIVCKDPGNESCPKMFNNDSPIDPNVVQINVLMTYAINEIENGNLTGQYSSNGLTVNWVSDSPEMFNSSIEIE